MTQAPVKQQEMDWQLVASYFTVKSTDIFSSELFDHGVSQIFFSEIERLDFRIAFS